MEISNLGIDLAKNIFQLHGVNSKGKKVLARKISRNQLSIFIAQLKPCIISMEACGSSHYWARKFQEMGHTVKLIAPQFVKPFVKSNKNDANDAEAIVEASLRPNMRFVAVKSQEQQVNLSFHRVRERLVSSKTALINEIRGLLSEFGIIINQGAEHVRKELPSIIENADNGLTDKFRLLFNSLYEELKEVEDRIEKLDKNVLDQVKNNEVAKRLMTIPGVGPITASAIFATIGDANIFKNGREMSAWLGVVPRQNSSGGKTNLGGISKRGDKYLRKLLIHGARAVLVHIENKTDRLSEWLKKLVERRGYNRAAVALANKNMRIAWAIMTKGALFEKY